MARFLLTLANSKFRGFSRHREQPSQLGRNYNQPFTVTSTVSLWPSCVFINEDRSAKLPSSLANGSKSPTSGDAPLFSPRFSRRKALLSTKSSTCEKI